MTAASQVRAQEPPATATLWRCGGRQCPPGECDHDEGELHRHASGAGPAHAPPIVHQVLRSTGAPLPAGVRADMEGRLGHSFGDVRVHTDSLAAESVRAVGAHAYTVGRHIAFGSGRFDATSGRGRHLLTHELSHAAQSDPGSPVPSGALRVSSPDEPEERRSEQVARGARAAGTGRRTGRPSGGAATIWRRWEAPTAGECNVEPGRSLTKVVVDQEKAQSVTLHWNDGSVESGMCSTGKGHCCTDTSDGVAGSVAESRRSGSNLTPITAGQGKVITDRFRNVGGWQFWSTFDPARSIGLHTHHTVTGTPLSHGCVRMHQETAQKIFCGARQNQTRVEVRGYARPDCAEPELKEEWRRDFLSAGRAVDDGENVMDAASLLRARKESRRMLKESYERDLTDVEIKAGRMELLPLPRCRSRAAEPSEDERGAIPETGAATGQPSESSRVLASSGLESHLPALSGALAATRTLAQARAVVEARGTALLAAAGGADPLRWARLAMTRIIRQSEPAFVLSAADRAGLIAAFEKASTR